VNAGTTRPGFQYTDIRHQSESSLSGMWLFLASECLFFGALFLAWIYARHFRPAGFDHGAQLTSLTLGTCNSLILITSGLIYAAGIAFMERGQIRRLLLCCRCAMLLGVVFLALKFGLEWPHDFAHHFFPGPQFGVTGPEHEGAMLFFTFYFVATALHGVHILIGLVLIEWVVRRARRGDFSARYHTPVTAVGLYWAFVDVVWIVLYPLIYLIGREAA
jgi:cytochrome c oxidase subunit III